MMFMSGGNWQRVCKSCRLESTGESVLFRKNVRNPTWKDYITIDADDLEILSE